MDDHTSKLADSWVPIHIENMAVGGSGVGRVGDLVVFVPDSAPNEDLIIQIKDRKKNFAVGEIREIIKPSPHRRPPPCSAFPQCGGCNWQHFSESEQLQQKKIIVESTLKKFLKDVTFPESKIHKSPKAFRYRNRVQPKFKNGKMGFFERNSYRIVNTEDCLIAEEEISKAWPLAKKWATSQQFQLKKKNYSNATDPIIKFEIRLTSENKVEFDLIGSQSTKGPLFSQINRFQNLDLIECILELSKRADSERVIDLYSGSGNFSIPLAKSLAHQNIRAVEFNRSLVELGKSKSNQLNLTNIDWTCADVGQFLEKEHLNKNDLIILDPPRTGCSPVVMEELARQGIKKLIYISCHPVTLARDLKQFKDLNFKYHKGSITIRDLNIFEMFPQTDHVETILSLEIDS